MRPKKKWGQHFLTSLGYIQKIVDSIPAEENANILEIGPGKGALSKFLQKRFTNLHLVEIDPEAIELLQNNFQGTNIQIHHSDVLKFDYSECGFPLHVVGNLPYNIGAHIIKKTLLYGLNIISCTFMVQREVAERICAKPDTKQNGFLSIFCQFFGTPKILFHIPPGAFFPPPSIDSSVFQLVIRKDLDNLLPKEAWHSFFSFVDSGFSMRRKQLAKVLSMKNGNSKEFYSKLLIQIGSVEDARAEDLSIDSWLKLYKEVNRINS